ncbi:hypothetical protein M2277_005171 [Paenibacillus sp. LBL]|uniref:hypothetical protein n=1 Tax=Paenibacillus sp. LBL TaxID=2940563 RepID=UPI002474ED65|nr:hypothetical protein [Paenibacillus sp. LBL]MDH6674475.1 hypothetical protein [Paenibacillus sp. LBL]
MAFDKQAPTWSAPGVEPPESKKQEGWQVNDKPPAAWLNWFMSLTAESLKELQQKAAEKSDITTINSEIDGLKQSGVDGKNRLETAIIAKEGTVSKQGQVATFEELDNGIHSIPTGTDTSDATAASGDIISGKTAYGPSGKITGTIPDRGAGGTVIPGATDQSKAAGRYTTAITIKGVPVPADKVLAGTTIAGTAGTMPNRGAGGTVTPGTTNQTKAAGYYSSLITILGDPDLISANIRAGVDIFGVIGSLIEGPRYASGTVSNMERDATRNVDIGFLPKIIIGSGIQEGTAGQRRSTMRYGFTQGDYITGFFNAVDFFKIDGASSIQQTFRFLTTGIASFTDIRWEAWG